MNKTQEWQSIMDGFLGFRLAVHTDLADGNANMVNVADLKTQEALGWLFYHRLVWKDGDRFVARMPREASAEWREHGAAREGAGHLFKAYVPPPPVPIEESLAAGAVPHRMKPGQGDLFG